MVDIDHGARAGAARRSVINERADRLDPYPAATVVSYVEIIMTRLSQPRQHSSFCLRGSPFRN